MNTTIAVTGMGCICAAGATPDACWEALCQGRRERSPATALHPDALPYPFFAVPPTAFATGQRRSTSADSLDLARHAARQALTQAGLTLKLCADMAVIVGTTAGSSLHFHEGYRQARAHQPHDGTDIAAYFNSNMALCLAEEHKTHGPALTLANACTSGADAIGLAAGLIAQGQCPLALCGGADALSLVPHTGFARLMIYSPEPCRPFDVQRAGLNLGEGAGMLVLESATHAARRGVKPLGFIAGYGAAADAHHFTAPHPEAHGLARAVDSALHMAGSDVHDLAFINAHGTATPENDRVEGRFFAQNFARTPVWGSKGVTGHTLGAAGALEAIFCLMALERKCVPPTWGFDTPDADIGLAPTRVALALVGACALSTSLAFGGGNAALVLARGRA